MEQDNLEITATKTCLDVLKQLGQAFSSAMDVSRKGLTRKVAPFLLKNETGIGMVLDLEHSPFKVVMKNRSHFHSQSIFIVNRSFLFKNETGLEVTLDLEHSFVKVVTRDHTNIYSDSSTFIQSLAFNPQMQCHNGILNNDYTLTDFRRWIEDDKGRQRLVQGSHSRDRGVD